tara:strand:- start:1533 stop:2006 length:474 start_codon:yes stop_codon:yes gene_type:complete
MAKKNTIKYVVVALAVMLIAYIIMQSKSTENKGDLSGVTDGITGLESGCYPLEEVHEVTTIAGDMWVSIIPHSVSGQFDIRPESNSTEIGNQFTISNTGSALDGTYTITSLWYDAEGKIGSLRTNVPSGYNFNYNATQGNGDVRDMTYFGIGKICLI